MKRRSFFASVAALFAATKVESKSQKPDYPYKNYAIMIGPGVEKKNPLVADGEMIFHHDHIEIVSKSSNAGCCHLGDIIATTNGLSLLVTEKIGDVDGEMFCVKYRCSLVQPRLKTILWQSVIQVHGKYKLLRNCRNENVQFMPIQQTWREGSI